MRYQSLIGVFLVLIYAQNIRTEFYNLSFILISLRFLLILKSTITASRKTRANNKFIGANKNNIGHLNPVIKRMKCNTSTITQIICIIRGVNALSNLSRSLKNSPNSLLPSSKPSWFSLVMVDPFELKLQSENNICVAKNLKGQQHQKKIKIVLWYKLWYRVPHYEKYDNHFNSLYK